MAAWEAAMFPCLAVVGEHSQGAEPDMVPSVIYELVTPPFINAAFSVWMSPALSCLTGEWDKG